MRITQSLHKSARTMPNSIATIFGTRQRSFGLIKERVERIAAGLQSLGISSGSRIAILAHNSDNYIELMLAIFWAGGIAVPLNTRWSIAELTDALSDSGASMLFYEEHFYAATDALNRQKLPKLTQILCMSEKNGCSDYEQLVLNSQPVIDVQRSGNDTAVLLFTGGTTGRSKAVMLSHANLVAAGISQQAAGCGTSGGVYLHVAPMFHMADIQMMVNHFLTGGTHCVLPSFEPRSVLECIKQYGVTDVLLVPSMIQALVSHPDFLIADLCSLRTIFYGAAPMPQSLLERVIKVMPACEFIQGYGMTETCLLTMLPACYHINITDEIGGRRISSAGLELPLTELRIADDKGQECRRGEIGEIQVRGASVMSGYWNSPELTRQAFLNDWLRTGDLAFRDEEGFVHIVDRLKDMIITGGENVYSSEVENVLSRHPSVSQCAVIGMPDEVWGERVHAVIVTDKEMDRRALIDYCKLNLTAYKVPKSISVIDAMPLSPAGKILKSELRAIELSKAKSNLAQ
ncbi:class I adenylate-forming enzyme family protein [Zhongshania marina]|uniref:Long-chain fatty acid--CoA ligase n=1 Tax=Zhongshania marina TaxID=2304603 RepID=A0ABX9W5P1_9GAMM|nr:long-chain fatty acid--CoA ligase [Zhongshania marina]